MNEALIDQLGWALIHFLWQGAVVAALLVVALRLLSKSPATTRYGAGGLALVALALCPVVTLAVLAPNGDPSPPGVTVIRVVSDTPEKAYTAAAPTPSPVAASYLADRLPAIVGIWAFGVALLTLRLIGGLVVVERLKRRYCQGVPPEWQERFESLAARLAVRGRVVAAISRHVAIPSTVGVFRAIVIMPASVFAKLSPEQLEVVLAHELAHVARHDYFVNLLQTVLEAVLFYHPAVWWVSHVVRIEREHCCDDVAIRVAGSPPAYAETLALLEERRRQPSLTVSATGGFLMNRIRRILGFPATPIRPSVTCAAAVVLLGLVALVGSALPARATPASNKPEPETRPAEPATSTTGRGSGYDPQMQIPLTRNEYRLRSASGEEFLAALDSGALNLQGVTVSMAETAGKLPVLTLSGAGERVDQALRVIERWDRALPQVTVRCELRKGDSLLSAPTLRTLAGRAASCNVTSSAGGTMDFGVRVCPLVDEDGFVTLRVTLSTAGTRLIVPFALNPEEEIAVSRNRYGRLVLTATDLETKAHRSAYIPSSFAVLDGARFTVKASQEGGAGVRKSRLAVIPIGRTSNQAVLDFTGYRLVKGKFGDLARLFAKHFGVSVELRRGVNSDAEVTVLLSRDQGKELDVRETMFRLCKAGNADYDVRKGDYVISPSDR